jgi:hypothetical protein
VAETRRLPGRTGRCAVVGAFLLLTGCTNTGAPPRSPGQRSTLEARAATQQAEIRRPVYDRLGGGLLLPVVPRDPMRSRILRLDLATGALAPLPEAPCDLPAGGLALLDRGRLLAVGHFSASGSAAWPLPSDAEGRRSDVSVLGLPAGRLLRRRPVRSDETVESMAAPDPDGTALYLAVRNGAYQSALPGTYLRRVHVRSGVDEVAWPGPAEAARSSRENGFSSMAAPH